MTTAHTRLALVLLTVLSLLGACSSADEPTPTLESTRPAEPAPTATAVPAPTDTAEPMPAETAEPHTAEVPENAALKITGKVSREIGWLEETVRAMDTMKAESTNSQGDAETYTGVSLNGLLLLAVPAADATTVVFVADDGSTAEVSLVELLACADCIVSFRNRGGFGIVMPGLPGGVQVKGVVEIRVE